MPALFRRRLWLKQDILEANVFSGLEQCRHSYLSRGMRHLRSIFCDRR